MYHNFLLWPYSLFYGQYLATVRVFISSLYTQVNPGGAPALIRVLVYQLRKVLVGNVRLHPLKKLFISAIFGLYISGCTEKMFRRFGAIYSLI